LRLHPHFYLYAMLRGGTSMAEKIKNWLKSWTELATVARAFVLALVALVAAVAVLLSGIAYLNKIMAQIDVNREQTKAGVTILAQDIDKIQKTAAQNHDDLVALNQYLLGLSEGQVDAALSGEPPPVPPPILAPRLPRDVRSTPPVTGAPPMASAAPPAPVASQEPTKSRRPPTPGPKPEVVDPMKATDVFKK